MSLKVQGHVVMGHRSGASGRRDDAIGARLFHGRPIMSERPGPSEKQFTRMPYPPATRRCVISASRALTLSIDDSHTTTCAWHSPPRSSSLSITLRAIPKCAPT